MQRTFAVLIAVISWFALIAQFELMMQNRVVPVPETTIRFFSFFTILTNSLVALFFTARSLNLTIAHTTGLLTAVTVYIFTLGIVYQFLLRYLFHFTGLQLAVDELLHTINPLLVLLFWYFYEKKAAVKYGQIKSWLIYPLVYCIYTILHGRYSGFYPYPFVDVTKIGLQRTLLNCGLLILFFMFIALLFVAIGQRIAKKRQLLPVG
jgi:hypothetical protein